MYQEPSTLVSLKKRKNSQSHQLSSNICYSLKKNKNPHASFLKKSRKKILTFCQEKLYSEGNISMPPCLKQKCVLKSLLRSPYVDGIFVQNSSS